MGPLLYGIALGFSGMLILSVAHKVRTLGNQQAAAEPLLGISSLTRRFGSATIVIAAVVEIAVVTTLVLSPIVGFALLVPLLTGYAFALRSLEPGQTCNCLGAALFEDRGVAIARNVSMILASLFALVIYAFGTEVTPQLTETTVAVVLVLSSILLARYTLKRLDQRNSVYAANDWSG